MKSSSRIFRTFDGLIDRLLCVFGAVLFSQGPEFMQQYLQRLGGHLHEAQRQLSLFRGAASQSGGTLEEFIAQTRNNPNAGVVQLSSVMSDALDRTASLQAAHDAIAHSSLWTKPFVFIRHADPEIARATWSAYLPAVPTTIEGLMYALAGMLVCLLIYHAGIKAVFGLFLRKRTPAPAMA